MIWIIGSDGMLGKELSMYLTHKNILFTGTDKDCDIADLQILKNFAEGKNIKWIVNCSAYTAVDKAEDEKEEAFKINDEGVENLALIAKSIKSKIIHISTDYVFGGIGVKPYKENDPVNPLGVYGLSKLAGENKIKGITPGYFIIRTSWLYGIYGNNFVNTMIRMFNDRETLNVVNDQKGCPTWAYNLAEAIYCIIKNESDKFGLYHFSNIGEITWYEFACEIYNLSLKKGIIRRNVEIKPVSSEQYPSRVKRPSYSVLALDKIKLCSGIKLSDWRDSLNNYLDSINNRF